MKYIITPQPTERATRCSPPPSPSPISPRPAHDPSQGHDAGGTHGALVHGDLGLWEGSPTRPTHAGQVGPCPARPCATTAIRSGPDRFDQGYPRQNENTSAKESTR